jgi:Stress responsive A/B Barrel Domain
MPTIRHTVAFALPFPEGSSEEAAFLRSARELASLPGVDDFVVLQRIGDQAAGLPWSLSMEFSDQAAFDGYNAHPLHRAFVETVWLPTVTSFAESDFITVDVQADSSNGAPSPAS